MGQVGDRLRQAREAKGLTLAQAEEITKIRRRFLQALEEEDYGQLPGEVFVRGFLRNYAVVLGLDPEEILVASGRPPAPAIVPITQAQGQLLDEPLTSPGAGSHWMVGALSVMILVLVGLGAWTIYRYLGPSLFRPPAATPTGDPTQVPIVVQSTATRALTPTATATAEITQTLTPTSAPVTSGLVLRLEGVGRSWVTVTVDGDVAWAGTMEQGQSQEWQARERIDLHSGNAGGIRVFVNGQEQSIGDVGQVADVTWTAEEMNNPANGNAPPVEATPGPLEKPPVTETPTPTPSPTVAGAPAGSENGTPPAEGTPGPLGTPPSQPTASP